MAGVSEVLKAVVRVAGVDRTVAGFDRAVTGVDRDVALIVGLTGQWLRLLIG